MNAPAVMHPRLTRGNSRIDPSAGRQAGFRICTAADSQADIELLCECHRDSLSRRKDGKVERVPRWISVRLERVEGVFDRLSRAARDAERLGTHRGCSSGNVSVSL